MSYPAAIYARVSSDRQKENHTIASQTVALKEYAQAHDYLLIPAYHSDNCACCQNDRIRGRRRRMRRRAWRA